MSLDTLIAAANFLEGCNKAGPMTRGRRKLSSLVRLSDKRPRNVNFYSIEEADMHQIASAGSPRQLHNKLEKNRRALMKDCFEGLRQQIPAVSISRRSSNLKVLRIAVKYVQVLKSRSLKLEQSKQRLVRRQFRLQHQLRDLLNSQTAICESVPSPSSTDTADDDDLLPEDDTIMNEEPLKEIDHKPVAGVLIPDIKRETADVKTSSADTVVCKDEPAPDSVHNETQRHSDAVAALTSLYNVAAGSLDVTSPLSVVTNAAPVTVTLPTTVNVQLVDNSSLSSAYVVNDCVPVTTATSSVADGATSKKLETAAVGSAPRSSRAAVAVSSSSSKRRHSSSMSTTHNKTVMQLLQQTLNERGTAMRSKPPQSYNQRRPASISQQIAARNSLKEAVDLSGSVKIEPDNGSLVEQSATAKGLSAMSATAWSQCNVTILPTNVTSNTVVIGDQLLTVSQALNSTPIATSNQSQPLFQICTNPPSIDQLINVATKPAASTGDITNSSIPPAFILCPMLPSFTINSGLVASPLSFITTSNDADRADLQSTLLGALQPVSLIQLPTIVQSVPVNNQPH